MPSFNEGLAGLQAISAWQEHVYKQLHAHPELSFQETKTAALAASKLKELGYEVRDGHSPGARSNRYVCVCAQRRREMKTNADNQIARDVKATSLILRTEEY